jgi:hypothetical protein
VRATGSYGNQRGDPCLPKRAQIGFTVVPRIRGDERIGRVQRRGGGDYPQQQLVLRAHPMHLGIDNDLVGCVDGRHPSVSLNDALAGGHLRPLIIGAMALAYGAACAPPIGRVLREPRPQLSRVLHESPATFRVLGEECWFYPQRVFGPMPREHRVRSALHLLGVPLGVGTRTTPLLRRMARQRHAVDREHFVPDQSLPIADREHRGEDRGHLLPQGADKVRDGGEVRT